MGTQAIQHLRVFRRTAAELHLDVRQFCEEHHPHCMNDENITAIVLRKLAADNAEVAASAWGWLCHALKDKHRQPTPADLLHLGMCQMCIYMTVIGRPPPDFDAMIAEAFERSSAMAPSQSHLYIPKEGNAPHVTPSPQHQHAHEMHAHPPESSRGSPSPAQQVHGKYTASQASIFEDRAASFAPVRGPSSSTSETTDPHQFTQADQKGCGTSNTASAIAQSLLKAATQLHPLKPPGLHGPIDPHSNKQLLNTTLAHTSRIPSSASRPFATKTEPSEGARVVVETDVDALEEVLLPTPQHHTTSATDATAVGLTAAKPAQAHHVQQHNDIQTAIAQQGPPGLSNTVTNAARQQACLQSGGAAGQHKGDSFVTTSLSGKQLTQARKKVKFEEFMFPRELQLDRLAAAAGIVHDSLLDACKAAQLGCVLCAQKHPCKCWRLRSMTNAQSEKWEAINSARHGTAVLASEAQR